ncbi:hypothetical protein GCM10027072_76050 [Streptomyces bullii]
MVAKPRAMSVGLYGGAHGMTRTPFAAALAHAARVQSVAVVPPGRDGALSGRDGGGCAQRGGPLWCAGGVSSDQITRTCPTSSPATVPDRAATMTGALGGGGHQPPTAI